MDSKEIFQIIQNGSSNVVELIESINQLEYSMQTICGFLNNKGGTVIIGVDKTCLSYGLHITPKDLEEITLEIDKIVPTASIEISTIPASDGKYLIIIKCYQEDNLPYLYDNVAFDRKGSHTTMMSMKKYNKLLMSKNYAPK